MKKPSIAETSFVREVERAGVEINAQGNYWRAAA
jgi:hypothetical protein